MANKEIYRLSIDVEVNGTNEAKNKLSAMEKLTQQTEKKIKALNRLNASPSAKIKDSASGAISKIKSKATALNNARINLMAKITDNASNRISEIFSKLKRLDASQISATVSIKDEASSAAEKVLKKTEKLKDSVPTVRIKAEDHASSTINKLENKINGWIKAGAKKVISLGVAGTVALGGIGLGSALNTFAKFEQGLSNVKAVTDATDAQMKQLSDTAKSLGASTAWSASAVTDAEQLLGQAGYSVNETISALPGLLSLASAGSLDLSTATSIASSTLRAFNLSAGETTHVADVLASTANATNSDVTDLGESLKYVSPVAQSLGISMEDAVAAVGLLSNQAIVGSQAGTVLRQAMARLASPTDDAAEMMEKYGINAFDAQGNMKPLSGVVDNLNSSLKSLTSQQRADVISTIFGTESMSGVMALMNQGGQSLSDLSQKLKDTKGSADKMAETKLDNLLGQWEQLKGAAETMQINLGERLAPYAKQFVTWLTNKMPEIENKVVSMVDYLSKHTDDIKTLAMTIIGLGTAFTALSTAGKIGNTISGISSLLTVLKGAKAAEETAAIAGGLQKIGLIGRVLPAILSPAGLAIAGIALVAGTAIIANNNLMKKSLSTTTEELGPVEEIMNELHGHIYKSKEEMQQLGLVYEDFGGNISDTFKNKVKQSTKSIREFQLFINKINLDNVISDSESSEFDNRVNEMCYDAIKTIEDNKAKFQESMKAMFLDDGTFSEAEKTTLEYLSKDYDNNVTAEQTLRDKIYEIRKKAVEQNRALNEEDLKNIKDYQTQMAQIALESAGGNTDELLYAKNKFKARAQGLDITDGSELAQEAAKDRDSRIVEVKATYDTNLDKLKADLTKAEADHAPEDTINKIKSSIEENTRARSEKIAEINKLWNDDLDTLYKMSPNLKGRINKYDGSQLSGGDIEEQGSLEKIKQKYSDLNGITQSGFYGVRDNVTGTMNSIYVSVDERTGEITAALNATTGEAGAYTETMKSKAEELGNVYKNAFGGAIKYLGDMQATIDTSSKAVISSSGETIGELVEISTNAYGVTTSIADINGTPIQITSNANGVITQMKQVADAANSIPRNIKITTSMTGAALGGLGGHIPTYHPETGTFYAKGTDNAKRGVATVAEEGYEIVFGRQNRWFNGGEKVLTHKESKAFLENQTKSEPFQVKQGQYQVATPQVAVAGGGNNIQVAVQNNIDGNQDIDNIVAQAVNEFAYKLKEALTNIKK